MNCAVRVGLIYLVSGFGGSILSSLFLQESISVGASGALFGLLGAMLSELLTNWTIYANKVLIRPGLFLFGSFLSDIYKVRFRFGSDNKIGIYVYELYFEYSDFHLFFGSVFVF